jgi:pimeloyl-ACP methyl ester carboxylesterase
MVTTQPIPRRSQVAWTQRTVTSDGVRLACRDWGGPGLPVVLIHGLAGHAGEWDETARRLSPRYRVVVPDQRGQGASERYPEDVSRAAHLADVGAAAAQLTLGRPVLLGQSLGGHTAMLAAAAHPERVRGLVLIEAGPGAMRPEDSAEVRDWLDSWPVPFASREAAAAFFGGGSAGEGWAAGLEHRDGAWWPRFDRDVMVRTLAESTGRSWWEEWERVTCPILLVLAQSSMLTPRSVDEMLRRRPATVTVSIPGADHDLHLEEPEALHAVLSDFLGGLA